MIKGNPSKYMLPRMPLSSAETYWIRRENNVVSHKKKSILEENRQDKFDLEFQ